jgi:hypothetical protein
MPSCTAEDRKEFAETYNLALKKKAKFALA